MLEKHLRHLGPPTATMTNLEGLDSSYLARGYPPHAPVVAVQHRCHVLQSHLRIATSGVMGSSQNSLSHSLLRRGREAPVQSRDSNGRMQHVTESGGSCLVYSHPRRAPIHQEKGMLLESTSRDWQHWQHSILVGASSP